MEKSTFTYSNPRKNGRLCEIYDQTKVNSKSLDIESKKKIRNQTKIIEKLNASVCVNVAQHVFMLILCQQKVKKTLNPLL